MTPAAWFALALLGMAALVAVVAWYRRRHEVRTIEQDGIVYSQRLDGSFIAPDGRRVTDPDLLAALRVTVVRLKGSSSRQPNSDGGAVFVGEPGGNGRSTADDGGSD